MIVFIFFFCMNNFIAIQVLVQQTFLIDVNDLFIDAFFYPFTDHRSALDSIFKNECMLIISTAQLSINVRKFLNDIIIKSLSHPTVSATVVELKSMQIISYQLLIVISYVCHFIVCHEEYLFDDLSFCVF